MIRVKSLFVATVIGLALGLAAGSYAKTQDFEAHGGVQEANVNQ